MSMIADVPSGFVQYGNRTDFCDAVQGMLSQPSQQQLEKYKELADIVGVSIEGYAYTSLKNTAVSFTDIGRQWTYQYCMEFGWYQTANVVDTEAKPMRSKRVDKAFFLDQCRKIFDLGDSYTGPDITGTNLYYQGLEYPNH